MGKKTIHFCDLCGAEVADKRDLTVLTLPAYWDDGYGNDRVRGYDMEVCEECKANHDDLLMHYFAEIHVDYYGALTQGIELKKRPLALVADITEAYNRKIEELEEEHGAEVTDLEAELERLRDLKDELFETNFRLTAMLRGAGIDPEEDSDSEQTEKSES